MSEPTEVEALKATIRDMLPWIEDAQGRARGVQAAILHGLVLRAKGQIDPAAPPLPRAPQRGHFIVLLLSADAAVQMAAAMGEHSSYTHLATSVREIALDIDPKAGAHGGAWWVVRTPVPELWIEAIR